MREVVTKHAEHSVHVRKSRGRKSRHWPMRAPAQHVKKPKGSPLPGSPGDGSSAPGANGPAVSGPWMDSTGAPLGSY